MRTICFCNSTLAWGGGEVWHFNAARSFAKRGWRVLVVCRPDGELYAKLRDVPEVHAVPMAIGRLSFLNPLMRLALVRLFRRERVHALVMNLPSDLKAAAPAAKQAGVPHIVYRRGSALPVRDSALNRHLFGTVITRLVANSRATRDLVLINNPALIAESKISIIPNGVDIPAFDAALAGAASLESRFPDRADFFAPSATKPIVLGNAGRLNRQKAQHLVLEVGARLQQQETDFRIVIAGTGEREGELKEMAERLGIADKTLFTGFLDDMALFWQSIDVFVLTSLWEGFGNVVIEAGLARKPVLCFAISNLPELVTNGVNGFLFPVPQKERANLPAASHAAGLQSENPPRQGDNAEDSLDMLAEALGRLQRRPEQIAVMGANGRTMALQYSQEECMDTLERLLV